MGRGYVNPSALKLVGDRYGLRARSRTAVFRSTASEAACRARRDREVSPEAARGRALLIDGYNVLITVESALAGGVLLLGRDGCVRDLASLHGTFKTVEETVPALEAIGSWLKRAGIGPCRVLLDRPVSNSGRLAALAREVAGTHAWDWMVDLVPDPDVLLRSKQGLIATADSAVLDAGGRWLNLARHVVLALDPSPDWLAFPAAPGTER